MKIYHLYKNNGSKFGFEIENVYISTKKIAKLLTTIKGVTNIKSRKLFDFGNEYHIEFDYNKYKFVVWEPFSDNSRYWICLKEDLSIEVDISDLENVFIKYNPPILVKIIGDILSLKFKLLFK